MCDYCEREARTGLPDGSDACEPCADSYFEAAFEAVTSTSNHDYSKVGDRVLHILRKIAALLPVGALAIRLVTTASGETFWLLVRDGRLESFTDRPSHDLAGYSVVIIQ